MRIKLLPGSPEKAVILLGGFTASSGLQQEFLENRQWEIKRQKGKGVEKEEKNTKVEGKKYIRGKVN